MRLAKPLPLGSISETLGSKTGREVILYVDLKLEESLFVFLGRAQIKKKFRSVAGFIMSDRYDDEIYRHEMNSPKSKDVYAIKICVLGNYRIYCKEFYEHNLKRVVLIKLVEKKTQKLDKKLRELVDKIGGYCYEFIE